MDNVDIGVRERKIHRFLIISPSIDVENFPHWLEKNDVKK
jgi:hypothetical protein